MSNRAVKDASYEDYIKGKGYFIDKVFTFQLSNPDMKPGYKKDVSEVTGEGRPVRFPHFTSFPSRGEFIKTKEGMKEIRYVPGQTTIFVDKMTQVGKDDPKSYQIVFIDGYKIVEGYDTVLVDFLMHTGYNFSNPNRETGINGKFKGFVLIDKSAAFKTEIDNDRKFTEAKSWCNDADGRDILEYALPLFGQSFLIGKSIDELRWHLKQVAQRNAEKFLRDKDSEQTKKKGVILKAIDKGIISVSSQKDKISWATNTDHPFITSPVGIDAIDQFVDNTLTPDGERVYKEILRLLQPQGTSKVTYVAPPKDLGETLLKNASKQSIDEITGIVENLISENVIEKAGPLWLKFGEEKWKGKNALINELKANPEMLEKFEAELIKAKQKTEA